MPPRIPAAVSLLLYAMASGTIAEDITHLPDMTRALEVRIDGRMHDTLNAAGDRDAARDRQSPRTVERGTGPSGASAASGRTDGGSWKPYHSAM